MSENFKLQTKTLRKKKITRKKKNLNILMTKMKIKDWKAFAKL